MGVRPLFLLVDAVFGTPRTGGRRAPKERRVEQSEVVLHAWEELEPVLADSGFELIEVEFERHGNTDKLTLFIDSPRGVTIDDCALASRQMSALLDMSDFIDSTYTLEVSSPGIARPIRKPEDFERYAGERIKLKTYAAVDGRRRFSGVLRGCSDGLVHLESDGTEYGIHLENLKRASLDR